MNLGDIYDETVKGLAIEVRRSRYARRVDDDTDRIEEITSHPEEACLYVDDGRVQDIIDANTDEANEDGFPRVVMVIVNTTVIVPYGNCSDPKKK